ncbi:MAG: endonuclease/exonuclease/phosphatase, partial [Desulfocurvibacter africanus]
GRGHFPTYPVALPFLRYPLDHVFHSRSLRLVEFKRLPDIGSDHFPVYAEFSLEPEDRLSQELPKADEQDHEEARDTLRRAE